MFYLLSSITTRINGVREKTLANRPLHEGLMLLIYEHIKAQSIGKFPNMREMEDVDDNELEESHGIFDTKDNKDCIWRRRNWFQKLWGMVTVLFAKPL